jgi:hypothetical protein
LVCPAPADVAALKSKLHLLIKPGVQTSGFFAFQQYKMRLHWLYRRKSAVETGKCDGEVETELPPSH